MRPVRVVHVARMVKKNVSRGQAERPALEQAAGLVEREGVQQRGGGEPRHQRGVLHRVPGPVAAEAQHHVGPPGAEADAQREEQPAGDRPLLRALHPGLVARGRAAVWRWRTRRARPARRSRRTAPADAGPCRGAAAADSGRTAACRLRPSGTGWSPTSKTISAANTAPTTQSTITAPPVSRSTRAQVDQRDHHGHDGDQQQPEQERSLLPGPEARDAIEGRAGSRRSSRPRRRS